MSPPLLSIGFRPFFLLAMVHSIVLLGAWAIAFPLGRGISDVTYGPFGWHAHEMIFGYAAAVIAGFLLTAVRNWTGQETPTGTWLGALAGVWIVGRLVPWAPDAFRPLAVLADVAFLPLVAVAVGLPIARTRQLRNAALLVILLLLATANVVVHAGSWGTGRLAHYAAVDVVVLTILVVGGRVIPFFTTSALGTDRPPPVPALEIVAIGTPLVLLFEHPGVLPGSLVVALALVASLANVIRMARWYRPGVARTPLLWVLYLGYAWIVVGYALRAAGGLGSLAPTVGLHAFTAGGIGVMTVGMIARVSLGHTGRLLDPSGLTVAAFVLVNLAALLRVLPALLGVTGYAIWIAAAGAAWVLAFALLLFVYAPILVRPRADV